MLRLLNIVAICALIGSAVYAYSIKYQTAYRAEQIAKTKIEIKQERDAIAVLRAEWAYMTRPERIQKLADKYLDLKPLSLAQIAAATSLPQKSRNDSIGDKLGEIGLSLPATPAAAPATPTTPKSDTPKAKAATPKVVATTKAPSASQQSPSREQKKRRRSQDAGHDRNLSSTNRQGPVEIWRGMIRRAPSRRALTRARRACASSRCFFLAIYGVICGRLVYLGLKPEPATIRVAPPPKRWRRRVPTCSTAMARSWRPT